MAQSLIPSRCSGRDKLIAEGLFALKESPGPGMCCVRGCKKKHVDPRRAGQLMLCPRHYQQRWRTRNPKQASFATLRDHAKARRIKFTLTLDFFTSLTDAAGYWTQEPTSHGDRLSIDRIDIGGGYTPDNVRVITVSENVILGNRERFLDPAVRAILAGRRGELSEFSEATESSWLDDGDPF